MRDYDIALITPADLAKVEDDVRLMLKRVGISAAEDSKKQDLNEEQYRAIDEAITLTDEDLSMTELDEIAVPTKVEENATDVDDLVAVIDDENRRHKAIELPSPSRVATFTSIFTPISFAIVSAYVLSREMGAAIDSDIGIVVTVSLILANGGLYFTKLLKAI